jgi:hypothetical protein
MKIEKIREEDKEKGGKEKESVCVGKRKKKRKVRKDRKREKSGRKR